MTAAVSPVPSTRRRRPPTIADAEAKVRAVLASSYRAQAYLVGWWLLRPVCDPDGSLSLTRLLAIYFAILDGHVIEESHSLTGTDLALAIVLMAVAFGKSTFQFYLQRYELKQQLERREETKRVDVHVDETRRIIEERRLEDGAPPRSMPPVGAEVPE